VLHKETQSVGSEFESLAGQWRKSYKDMSF